MFRSRSRLIRGLGATALAIMAWLGAGYAQGEPIAFVGVRVLSQDAERLIPDETVIVDGARIVWVGPRAEAPLPPGVRIIPGQGATLMPGLVDGHVHMLNADERWFYLEAGVTTVMNWHGLRRHLDWRRQVEAGDMVGPRIVTAGPILDGDPSTRPSNVVVHDRAEAEAAVEAQVDAGYDFIKLYDNLSVDAFEGVIDAANRRGIAVTGHVPGPVGLARYMAGAPTVRGLHHLEELVPYWGGATDAELTVMASSLARSGMYVFPTVDVYESLLDHIDGKPGDWTSVAPATVAQWRWNETTQERRGQPRDDTVRVLDGFRRLLTALDRAGVPVIAGSDAPIPTLVPGRALHRELRAYRAMGLSPAAVLRSATVTPAAFLRRDGGVVRAGADADLILIHGDPLTDVGALDALVGVMVLGRWTDAATITAETTRLREQYRQARAAAPPAS